MPGKRAGKSPQADTRTSKPREARPQEVRSQKTRSKSGRGRPTIGLLISQFDSGLAGVVWNGVADAAREHDVNLIQFSVGLLGDSSQHEVDAYVPYELVSADLLDGLVVWGAQLGQNIGSEKTKEVLSRYHPLPIVNIGVALEGIPSLLVDNYQGMHDVVTHLIEEHGYRRIAFLSGPEANFEAQERYRAYADALAKHDIPFDQRLVASDREIAEMRQHVLGYGSAAYRDSPILVLLDGHKRRPGRDFDAVVGYNDMYSLGALHILRARDVHVPHDVAVAGFDDQEESRYATPPLTTVRQSFHNLGWRAVSMLLEQIGGAELPAQTILPLSMIVRQSCGCWASVVKRAAIGSADSRGGRPRGRKKPKDTLLSQRAQILFEMTQATGVHYGGVVPDVVELLLDKFLAEMTEGAPGVFLTTLEEILRQAAEDGSDTSAWQDAISALRRQALPLLDDDEVCLHAEDLWHQARLMIADATQRTQGHVLTWVGQQVTVVRDLGQNLITNTDIPIQMDLIAQQLSELDIPGCYISLYENPEKPLEWARLTLAYDQGKRIELESGGQRFPTLELLPDGMLPVGRQYNLSVQPLYLLAHQFGLVMFEAGPPQGSLYEELRRQISNGLLEVMLVQQMERRTLQLQTATEVSRAASSILDPQELIQRAVDLVRERFNLYYAGLFLVDQVDSDESGGGWAVLRASTGEAGRKMLERGHRLRIGGDSMIGQCLASQQARIALDVGEEAVRFDNPFLPETRSELALPLVGRGQVLGALTIQSAEEAAFSEEDIAVFQTMADQLANAITNARLFKETRDRADELAVLDEMARAMTALLDVDAVMQSIYRYTTRLMDTTNLYIALYDAQNDEVSFPFYVEGERIGKATSRRAGSGLTEHVIRTRAPLLIKENVEARVQELGIDLIGQNARSWLGVPLIVADQVIGVVAAQSYTTPRAYNEQHRELLSAIASQAAIALQNAHLFKQTQTRARELAALNELGQALATHLSLQDVLNEVYQGASRLLDTTNFYVALYDPDQDRITFPYDSTDAEEDKFIALSADQGLTGHIIRNRTSVLIEDNLPERLAEMGIEMVGKPALSWLGVPIMLGGQVLGVMGVQSYTTAYAYDEHDRELLSTLANQTAISIQNARLFEEQRLASALLSERVRELDCLNEIGRRIDESPPVPELLEWVAGRIPSAMHHSGACIAAVEFEGQVYGDSKAVDLPRQMVGGLRVGDERVGQVTIAYTEDREFLDEESALLGDIVRRLDVYIESRRLLEQMQAALEEVEATHRRYLEQAWAEYLEAEEAISYETQRPGVPALKGQVSPEVQRAIEQREAIVMDEGRSALIAPIALRGAILGALGVHDDDDTRQWTEDEINLVTAIAERMALAAENLRLLDQTQRRATREQLAREITDKMRRATDIDGLLQTAIREIADALGTPDAFVQLAVPLEVVERRDERGTGPLVEPTSRRPREETSG